VLEAVATAAAGDKLALEVVERQRDRDARWESRFSNGIEVTWAR
jgi:hypothetical protein